MTREEILPIAKPILFNTGRTIDILEDRKTATRRILKLPRYIKKQGNGLWTLLVEGTCYENQQLEEIVDYINPPYKAGDYLYVRETWSTRQSNACMGNTTTGCPYDSCETASGPCFEYEYIYKATDRLDPHGSRIRKWHPSIHMPKEAARIFLRVKDVYIARLRDMTLGDFLKEGVVLRPEDFNDPENAYQQAKRIFIGIWDSTTNELKYKWANNPWVWVIEFERVEVQ